MYIHVHVLCSDVVLVKHIVHVHVHVCVCMQEDWCLEQWTMSGCVPSWQGKVARRRRSRSRRGKRTVSAHLSSGVYIHVTFPIHIPNTSCIYNMYIVSHVFSIPPAVICRSGFYCATITAAHSSHSHGEYEDVG